MKVTVVGGGIAGLSASYYLAKAGIEVILIEKQSKLGGISGGFRKKGWEWYLDYTYRHMFFSDSDLLDFFDELGFSDYYYSTPLTSSLYSCRGKFVSYPLDTPLSFLRFPLLSTIDKVRAGIILSLLKVSPSLPLFEHISAESLLKKGMGKSAWNVLWEELFRKKFGKYAEKVLASFIWARIKKRTKKLGYVNGGYQSFIEFIEKRLRKMNVEIRVSEEVKDMVKEGEKVVVSTDKDEIKVDGVIIAISLRDSLTFFSKLVPRYLNSFRKVKYLHAIVSILETKEKLFPDDYWVSVTTPLLSTMVFVQHTNFVGSSHFNDHEILYLGNYVDEKDKRWNLSEREIVKTYISDIKKLKPRFNDSIIDSWVFKVRNAQPIFDRDLVLANKLFKKLPPYLFFAGLERSYPFDRGVNYAVKCGKEAAFEFLRKIR